jgi:hypothetical protein
MSTNGKTQVKVTLTLDFDAEFMSDLLITAFDGQYGGCWYWAEPKPGLDDWLIVEKRLVEGSVPDETIWRSATIREKSASLANGKKRWAVIDHAMIGRGLKRILETPNGRYTAIKEAIMGKDSGEIDASAVDTIIQFAVFGEEVYG